MSYSDPSQDPQPARTNRKMLYIVAFGGLILCALTAVAGYTIGRSTATSTTETTETVIEQSTVERSQSDSSTPSLAPTEALSENSADNEVAGGNDTVESPDLPTAVPTDPAAQVEPTSEPLNLDTLDISTFEEAWRIIAGEFYGDLPSNDELIYGAIEGSLETLDDPFTSFTRPEIARILQEDFGGTVEGIGAIVRENEEGFIEVVTPIEGQPAEAAGLRPGDIFLEVDGEDVLGQDLLTVVAKVRGPRGTQVTIKMLRPSTDEELTFTITRTSFEVAIVTSEMLENDIAYVQLTEFSTLASEQLVRALEELLAQNPSGLIFDLRNNGGGLLNQSVIIADLFMTDNIVLYQRDNSGGEEVYRADNGDIAEEIPLVVLINGGSASASEIVSGAIQDTGRGTIIGETSFGKGSVQFVHTLSDGSELRVTIARFFSPNDNVINGVGITPDIESIQDFDTEEDEQLQRAIEFLVNGE